MPIPAFIKTLLPVTLKKRLVPYLRARNMSLPPSPRAFVFLAADYGNIGDLAITAAQQRFLARTAPNHQVVLVPISTTREVIHSLRKQVGREDLVTIIGGGNMGSLYPDIEELRQLVIRSFPHNRTVCFPQTLDWNDSASSRQALNEIVRVYSSHSDLYVHAREAVSYQKLTEIFADTPTVKVNFVPDIVLSSTAIDLGATNDVEPNGALLCLRNDCERSLNASQHESLTNALTDAGLTHEVTDTHAGGSRLPPERCQELLANKLCQFQRAKLVVTDRLHGMILAALAGTPCLVLPNSNHKIRQTWMDWLSDVPQVRFLELDELPDIDSAVRELVTVARHDPSNPVVNPVHYNDLRMAIADL